MQAAVAMSLLAGCGTEDVRSANSARLCKLAHNCISADVRREAQAELIRRGINPDSLECSKIAEDAMDPRRRAPVPVVITNY